MADEMIEFGADAGKLLGELARIEKAQKEVRLSINAATKAAKEGSVQAGAAYVEQARKADALRGQHQKLDSQLKQLVRSQGQFNFAVGRANMVVGQLSYAMDDFLTVVGDSGLAGGLKAAGNNLSVVLAQVNPMLAIVPALAGAVALWATKTGEHVDATKAQGDALKEAQGHMERHKELIEGLAGAFDKATMSSEALGEQEAKRTVEQALRDEAERERKVSYEWFGVNKQVKEQEEKVEGLKYSEDTEFLDAAKRKLHELRVRQHRLGKEREESFKRRDEIIEAEKRRKLGVSVAPGIGRAVEEAERQAGDDAKAPGRMFDDAIQRRKREMEAAKDRVREMEEQARSRNSPGGVRVLPGEQRAIEAARQEAEKQTAVLEKILEELRGEKDRLDERPLAVPVDRPGAA